MSVLLARGRLLALWPASVLRFAARKFSVKVLPVKLPPLARPLGVITLRGRTIGPVAQLFIESAREVASAGEKSVFAR
jgi:DNA-binding transcriptional LysR family regulator